MRESDLAAKIVGWLNEQHYEVYQEVQGPVGGIADLVAVMGCRLWVIETKTSLSLSVMQQAHRWKPYAHWVSVGIPYNSGHGFPQMVCKQLGIGILRVHMAEASHLHMDVTESLPAQLNRRAIKHFRLHEAQKTYAAAGNNNGQHWSPYKQTCMSILEYVRAHPGCCLRDLIQNIKHHYASRSGATQCVSYWAQAGKVPGVECRRDGKYLRFYESEKTR